MALGERAIAVPTLRAATAPLGAVARRLDRLGDRAFAALVFLPGGLVAAAVLIPPVVAVIVMSFLRVELLKQGGTRFVDFLNYSHAFDDPDFLATVPRTVVFAAASIAISIPLAVGIALLLARRFRGVSLLGIIVLLPWAIAPVATGIYWRFMFTGDFGLVNGILEAAGIATPPNWLNEPKLAMGVAVCANVWRSVPLLALIVLAALKGIPSSLYRAARMDGANSLQTFRFVTLPSIAPALLIATILQLILSLQVFDIIYSLTHGGPGAETRVMSYHIYLRAFGDLSFGYSSALAVLLLLLIAASSAFVIASFAAARRLRAREVEAL